jgi:hypothetical protein
VQGMAYEWICKLYLKGMLVQLILLLYETEANTNLLLSRINAVPFVPECESVTKRQSNDKTFLVGLKIALK